MFLWLHILELCLTWFKKYICSLQTTLVYWFCSLSLSKRPNCSHLQPSHQLSRVSGIKTCQKQQKQETSSSVNADPLAPTEIIKFISVWGDSFTNEGYNFVQVALITFITFRWINWYHCRWINWYQWVF